MNALLAALINGGVASALTAAMIWVVLHLAPRNALNAATRYAIWWAALIITIALPVLYLPVHVTQPAIPIAQPSLMLQTAAPRTPLAPMSPAITPRTHAASFRMPAFPVELQAAQWPRWILAAWMSVALMLLVRLMVSLILLDRLRARVFEIRGALGARIQDRLGLHRPIRLIASRDIATPVAVGPWHPSIMIPAALLKELDASELEQVCLHEAAHFARRDDCALMLQRVIEALLALHPVVRWIARRIDLEREIACDDLVIAATGNPVSYAACLIRIVELSGGVRSSLAAVAAAEDNSHFARRVNLLLDKTRHTGTLLLKGRLIVMLATVTVLALAAGRVSGLVAFAQPLASHAKPFQAPQVAKVTMLPQQASAPVDQVQDLAGKVLEDSSGNPLASAELRFHKTGMQELAADLETDRQGRFTAPGLPPGEYTVEAVKPNYVTTTFKLRVPSGSPLIRLVRYGVIDGQVMDAQGKPLPGRVLEPGGRTKGSTRVTILVKPAGSEELQIYRETFLEDAGHYRVFDLPPGEYALGVWYSGLNDGSGMQLYPDNSHPRMFTVQGGEEYNNINFIVVAHPGWRVSGKVVLPEGVKGQFQLALGLPEQPTLPVGQALTESDGSFHFEKVPAGTYDLFAAGPTGGYTAFESILGRGQPLFGRTRINVAGQNLEDLSVSVGAGRSLKAVLRAAGSDAVPEGCPQKASLSLMSLEPWGTVFMSRGQAEFGKEQVVSNLAPGRFRVEANDLGSGCFQVKRPVVDLSAEVTEPVALELASAGSIKGVLHGAGKFAVVLLDVAATDAAQARLAFPDGEGRFGFEALPPGHYRISAQPSGEATRARWVSSRGGKEIEVAGGAPTQVELSAPGGQQ